MYMRYLSLSGLSNNIDKSLKTYYYGDMPEFLKDFWIGILATIVVLLISTFLITLSFRQDCTKVPRGTIFLGDMGD